MRGKMRDGMWEGCGMGRGMGGIGGSHNST